MPSDIHPPTFDVQLPFDIYRRDVNLWIAGTTCPVKSQAARLAYVLTGAAREHALGLDITKLQTNDATGVKYLLDDLEKVFGRDKTSSLFTAIEKFEKFFRPPEQPIPEFISEFSTRLNELKQRCEADSKDQLYGSQILAYRLLEQANLSPEQKRLLRATCPKIGLEEMIESMKRTFGAKTPRVKR